MTWSGLALGFVPGMRGPPLRKLRNLLKSFTSGIRARLVSLIGGTALASLVNVVH